MALTRSCRPRSHHSDSLVEVDTIRPFSSAIDIAEREYRSRVQPNYPEASLVGSTVDPPAPVRSVYREDVKITEDTIEVPRRNTARKSRMGYYDEHGKSYKLVRLLVCPSYR